jgi:hypothetical protein
MTAAPERWPVDGWTRVRLRWQARWASLAAGRRAKDARRFHAFAVGLPRSGTHSLAEMFQGQFRAAHEPALVDSLAHTMSWNRGEQPAARMRALLRWRDRRLGLELEAAHYLHHVAPLLVEEFPAARFVLTLREPVSWLESEINQNLRAAEFPFWRALAHQRYGRYGAALPAAERGLADAGCAHAIAAHLHYWRDHIEGVLAAVPNDRLLVVRTDQLDERAPELAAFLGVAPDLLDRSRSRAGAGGPRRIDLRALVDPDHLAREVERHCADLLTRWFPERA